MQDRNNNGKLHSTNFPTVKYRKIDDFMNELEPIKQLQNIDGTKTYSVGKTFKTWENFHLKKSDF